MCVLDLLEGLAAALKVERPSFCLLFPQFDQSDPRSAVGKPCGRGTFDHSARAGPSSSQPTSSLLIAASSEAADRGARVGPEGSPTRRS